MGQMSTYLCVLLWMCAVWLIWHIITGAWREKRAVDEKHVGVFDFPEITLEGLEELRAERKRSRGL